VDDEGLTVNGTVNATAGNIGGCSIENGVLKIANANIENLNASKITAGTLSVDRIAEGSLTGGKLDDYTIDAIIQFQQYCNSEFGMNLPILDYYDPVIDDMTLDLLLNSGSTYANPDA